SCGNTWRGTRRRLDRGAHSIRSESSTIKDNQRKTWHYIFVSASPRLKSYQRLTRRTHAQTVEDQIEDQRGGVGRCCRAFLCPPFQRRQERDQRLNRHRAPRLFLPVHRLSPFASRWTSARTT